MWLSLEESQQAVLYSQGSVLSQSVHGDGDDVQVRLLHTLLGVIQKMNQVWQKGNYKIYHSDDGYILHNASMDGFAHSHLKSFKMAVLIADLAEHKRIPHHYRDIF